MTSAKQTAGTLVVGLYDPDSTEAAVVGNKAANLARLAASGHPVPDGFVVTTAACNRILNAPAVPEEVWSEIGSRLERLGPGPVAVRSSGTAEDLLDASHAGQYETVLDVQGPDAVIGAIRRCLDSASSERVRAYRGAGELAPMAVVVQRMVQAEAAGVAFTANPVTGDAEVLVSSVKGLGDRLVSGEATPDEWVVRGGETECRAAPEGALTEVQVRQIAARAQAIEALFGSPQDIEWAIADNEVAILQARPITALPVPPDIGVPTDGFWTKDDAHFPTPFTPFGASVYLPALSDVMRPLAEDFGVLIEGFESLSLGGEVYMHTLPFQVDNRPASSSSPAARQARALRRRARAAEVAMSTGLAEATLRRWEDEWRSEFDREFRGLLGVGLESLDDRALLGHLEQLKDLLRRGEEVHFRLVAPMALALHELGETCRELLGWDGPQTLSLVTGASQASAEPGRQLRALAARVAAHPVAREAFTSRAGGGLSVLRQSSPALAEEFDQYLDRYGHRPISYDPGDPTLFERPEIVAGLLGDLVRNIGGPAREAVQPDPAAQARTELAGSSQALARFEAALAYAQRAYGQREDNIVFVDNQPCALLRYCALEFGRRLVERGVLARADDAVFLDEAELRAALTGQKWEPLHALVARRKAERAWVIAHPGPPSYGTPPGPPPELSTLPPALRQINTAFIQMIGRMSPRSRGPGQAGELRGLPASPGRYSGTVRVVRDPSEFAKLEPGDVLVAPATSPAWSVLFLNAGAVVTDGGGVLSHTAVIAREYGIPAVLATGDATRRLSDGQVVTVDGSAGVVSVA